MSMGDALARVARSDRCFALRTDPVPVLVNQARKQLNPREAARGDEQPQPGAYPCVRVPPSRPSPRTTDWFPCRPAARSALRSTRVFTQLPALVLERAQPLREHPIQPRHPRRCRQRASRLRRSRQGRRDPLAPSNQRYVARGKERESGAWGQANLAACQSQGVRVEWRPPLLPLDHNTQTRSKRDRTVILRRYPRRRPHIPTLLPNPETPWEK